MIFYINVGKNVSNSIQLNGNEKSFTDYLCEPFVNSICIEPVDKQEIEKIVNNLDDKKAFGYDNIHPKLLKISKDFIVEPLTYIINKSLMEGIFPDNLKIAKVVPIFKSGDKFLSGNYRPISLLPVLSKIFERVMYNRLVNFLNRKNFFYKFQYGFRENHDTKIAIAELINNLQHNLDKGLVSVGIFIDLKKAFDTVNHKILLQKLYHYGVRGCAHEWFKSYLSNRKQFVKINNAESGLQDVTCGVPQGSIIGPLLFLIYVNDMVNSVMHGEVKMFADDTNIFYSSKNIHSMVSVIEDDLQVLNSWLKVNKLCVNVRKCNFMVIQGKNKKRVENVKIKFCNDYLEEVESCKYLGIFIDNSLSWKCHITFVCKKIRPVIGILSKIRHLLPVTVLRTLYYTLIHPHILYCIETWGTTFKSYMEPLYILHKKLVRIITFSHFIAHTKPLYTMLNILPIPKIIFQNISLLVYKELNTDVPIKFNFQLCSNTHSYATRKSTKGYLYNSYKNKTNYFSRSIFSAGIHIFNVLPEDIINAASVYIFKRRVKSWLHINDINIYDILGI